MKLYANENLPKLNEDQRKAFNTITERIQNRNKKHNNAFFIDGPGGCGKTFLYQTILSHVRAFKKIALAVASSGIAAQLLTGGRTAHSRLKIPFALGAESTCKMLKQTDYAKFIQASEIIIWDECPMMHRHAFEALDRSLRDIMGAINPLYEKIPFGNKIIIFGGDFRQILPVVKRGCRDDIVNASFNRSEIWANVKILKLTINMRIQRLAGNDQKKAQEFSNFLMHIGNGTMDTYK